MKKIATKRKRALTQLANGCSRTEIYYSPKDCLEFSSKSDYPKTWFVECRFHDPQFKERYPTGFPYRKSFSSDNLHELKLTAKVYKEEMERGLDELHYNPITKKFFQSDYVELNPGLPFMDALWKVRDKINFSKDYISLSRQILNRMEKVLPELGYSNLRIMGTRIFHIKNILQKIYTTESVFNKQRSCLKTMFDELLEYGCVEFNPVSSLKKKMELPGERNVFDDGMTSVVLQYLHDKYPTFYRYTNIFRYSGARSTELFRVQKKHVDLENQEYKALIKKRRNYEWVTKVIIPAAIPYWRQILLECKNEDDFIFSKDLRPGPLEISSKQIQRRWRNNIKNADDIIDPVTRKQVKVEVDFYTWKHMFLDKLDELQNNAEMAPIVPINLAQGMASHKSADTTNKYTIGKKNRDNEILKKISLR